VLKADVSEHFIDSIFNLQSERFRQFRQAWDEIKHGESLKSRVHKHIYIILLLAYFPEPD